MSKFNFPGHFVACCLTLIVICIIKVLKTWPAQRKKTAIKMDQLNAATLTNFERSQDSKRLTDLLKLLTWLCRAERGEARGKVRATVAESLDTTTSRAAPDNHSVRYTSWYSKHIFYITWKTFKLPVQSSRTQNSYWKTHKYFCARIRNLSNSN